MVTHRYTSKEGVIIGKDGIYSGSMFKIPLYGELKIGREPSECEIVISSDCVNISRVHCAISYNVHENAYYIKDTSSNGTIIIANGEKTMIKSQTMKVYGGGTFYLGDYKNSFRLL